MSAKVQQRRVKSPSLGRKKPQPPRTKKATNSHSNGDQTGSIQQGTNDNNSQDDEKPRESSPSSSSSPPPSLYSIHQVREWLRFNQYILGGYRGASSLSTSSANETAEQGSDVEAQPLTKVQAALSFFTLHNESVNVWSHFFPALFFTYLLFNPPSVYYEGFLAKLVTVGSMVILYASSIYHLFMPCCTQRSGYLKLLACDVLAALFSVTTSAYSFLLLGSRCSPWIGSGGGGLGLNVSGETNAAAAAGAVAAAAAAGVGAAAGSGVGAAAGSTGGGEFNPTLLLWFIVILFTGHALLVMASVLWVPTMSAMGRVGLFGSLCTLRLVLCTVTSWEKYKYSNTAGFSLQEWDQVETLVGTSQVESLVAPFSFVHDTAVLSSAALFSRAYITHSISYFTLLLGGIINSQRIPERWMVEKKAAATASSSYATTTIWTRPWYWQWIDYCFNSHNLWHFLSLVSVLLTQLGTGYDAMEWEAMKCVAPMQ